MTNLEDMKQYYPADADEKGATQAAASFDLIISASTAGLGLNLG